MRKILNIVLFIFWPAFAVAAPPTPTPSPTPALVPTHTYLLEIRGLNKLQTMIWAQLKEKTCFSHQDKRCHSFRPLTGADRGSAFYKVRLYRFNKKGPSSFSIRHFKEGQSAARSHRDEDDSSHSVHQAQQSTGELSDENFAKQVADTIILTSFK